MNNEKIQVYIMTRNRLDTVTKAIDSVLSQTYPSIELIVSDNSTNNSTYELLSSYFGRINYIRRSPTYESGIEHINAIIKEVTSDYFMIFHDDDEMLPEMVETLFKTIKKDNSAAAASNALVVHNNKSKSLYYSRRDSVIDSTDEMVRRYSEGGSAPFPAYLYNKRQISGLYLDWRHGHKYCDASFIVDISKRGCISLVGKPLMIYNIHQGQDSQSLDFIGHVSLTNYLRRRVSNKRLLTGLRLFHIYGNAVAGYKSCSLQYKHVIASLLFKYSPREYFPKYIIRLLQSKFYTLNK